jgi:hypothetical protein
LKAGEWFRRGRLLMVSPVHGDYRRCQAEIPLIVLFRFPGPALIAQFAALLRSLTVQVIKAVHEQSLFEYLTLELSPTFVDDRLIMRGPDDNRPLGAWNVPTRPRAA